MDQDLTNQDIGLDIFRVSGTCQDVVGTLYLVDFPSLWYVDDKGNRVKGYVKDYGKIGSNPRKVTTQLTEAKRTFMLDEAKELIYGQRAKDYGPAIENFSRIAKIWSVCLGIEVTPTQVCGCMIGMKLARLVNGDFSHRDSWVDIAGYVGCVDKINNGE